MSISCSDAPQRTNTNVFNRRDFLPFPTPFPTPKGCGSSQTSTNDSEQPISRGNRSGTFRVVRNQKSSSRHKKRQSTDECPANRNSEVFRSPTYRGHLDAMRSSIHIATSCSFQTTLREPNWISLEFSSLSSSKSFMENRSGRHLA